MSRLPQATFEYGEGRQHLVSSASLTYSKYDAYFSCVQYMGQMLGINNAEKRVILLFFSSQTPHCLHEFFSCTPPRPEEKLVKCSSLLSYLFLNAARPLVL